MIVATILLISAICGLAQSSDFHPIAPAGAAPVVTAASSQYFERTFNRLVAVPQQQPVIPVAPAPPVIVDARTTPVIPTQAQPLPADPNIAIAIATAQAAAPVATILLPPYPFGIPPTFGLVPSVPPFEVPSDNPNRESTTQKPSTILTTTTEKDLEVAPLPSSNANSFAQAVPSNQNVNFRQYLAPQRPPLQSMPPPVGPPLQQPAKFVPQPPRLLPQPIRPVPQSPGPALRPPQPQLPQRPLKLKTTVEVVPVPLTYIAPPPIYTHADIHSHDHHHHPHIHLKAPRHIHIHSYIPKRTKIIIRPVRLHSLRRAGTRLVAYKAMARSSGPRYPQNALRTSPKEREPTTFRPINRPATKPPRI